jgi:hypothetical protein
MIHVSAILFAIATASPTQQQSAQLSLTVVDEAGIPISGAMVDYTRDHSQRLTETNANGQYTFTPYSAAIVIRKSGYRSKRLLTDSLNGSPTSVVLDKLPAGRRLPLCRDLPTQETIGISGWESSFRFRKIRNIRPSRQGADVDYGIRTYRRADVKKQAIVHGSGSMWSFGSPDPDYVLSSVEFEEASFEIAGRLIIDARGRFPDGTRWRVLARFGETASCKDASDSDAALFDRFLDGACFAP